MENVDAILSGGMHIAQSLHLWKLSPRDAIALQKRLVSRLTTKRLPSNIANVCGVDVSFNLHSGPLTAAAVVWSIERGRVVEVAVAAKESSFPYVPGLLSFREGPVVLEVLSRLSVPVDAVMFDGHGIAHPRGFGLAAHLGLWLDVPTLGVAKSRLCGTNYEPRRKAGSKSVLHYKGDKVGFVLRTRDGTKPVYVSHGNNLGLAGAVRLTLRCCRGRRLPEPTRLAHIAAGMAKTGDCPDRITTQLERFNRAKRRIDGKA